MKAFASIITGIMMTVFAASGDAAADNSKVIFKTSKGDITVELLPDKAPKTVVFGELPKTSTGKIQKFVLRDQAKAL